MSAPIVIDNTMGAAFIGVIVAGILYGVSAIQCCYYFTHQSDRWELRGLVAVVMAVDTVHQILISHTVYTYLVSNYANPPALGSVVWSLLVEVLFNGLAALFVQCFLTFRIWKLSSKKIWITALAMMLVLAEFGCVLAFSVIALLRVKTFAELAVELKGLSITVNALAACGDVVIAGTLTYLLQNSKTGFRRSDTMINKLTIFAVNTGALTSLCAIASLTSILAAPNTFIYIAFFFCMGRLYANSLLATLNARKMIRKAAEGINSTGDQASFALKDYAKNSSFASAKSSSRQQRPQNISIKIDTTMTTDLDGPCPNRSKGKEEEAEADASGEESELSGISPGDLDLESNLGTSLRSLNSNIEAI